MKRRANRKLGNGMESLEGRRLMAADVALSNGLLSIQGTDAADTITIEQKLVSDEFFASKTGSIPHVAVTIQNPTNFVIKRFSVEASKVTSYTVDGLAGNDTIINLTSRPGAMTGGPGNDSLQGGAGAERFYGKEGDDNIRGGDGDDQIFGGFGDDTLMGDAGHDSLYGEFGFNRLFGGDGWDNLLGGFDVDELFGGDGDDILNGGDGDDLLRGGMGNDLLIGGEHNDAIFGDNGDDLVFGGRGNDSIWGGYGVDEIHGGDGDDFVAGGPRVTNSVGNVVLNGDNDGASDSLYGDAGRDTFEYDKVTRLVRISGILTKLVINRDAPLDFDGSAGDKIVNWY